MKLTAAIARFIRRDDAVAAIEFAIIAPVVVFLAAAILELGLYFQAYDASNKLAAQYAISFSDCSDFPAGTCLTEAAYYTNANAVRNLAPRINNANATVRVFQVVSTGGTNFTTTYASPVGAVLTNSEKTYGAAKLSNGEVGVIVSVSYTHTLMFFAATMAPFLGSKLVIPSIVALHK